jgi:hypothetical protein
MKHMLCVFVRGVWCVPDCVLGDASGRAFEEREVEDTEADRLLEEPPTRRERGRKGEREIRERREGRGREEGRRKERGDMEEGEREGIGGGNERGWEGW